MLERLKRLIRPKSDPQLLLREQWTEKNNYIHPAAILNDETILEGNNSIYERANVAGAKLGRGTYIGHDCNMTYVSIGRYCSISWDVDTAVGEHPIKRVSMHPAFYSAREFCGMNFCQSPDFEEFRYSDKPYYITIGNDVLIGPRVIIAGGVRIGDGAVIRAGSFVTKDVPPYAVVMGNPGEIVKYRFEPEDIEFLQRLKWWEKDDQWLAEHNRCFSSVKELREVVERA